MNRPLGLLLPGLFLLLCGGWLGSSCSGPVPQVPDATAEYFVAIGEELSGKAQVAYSLDLSLPIPVLTIAVQTVLNSPGVTIYDSTRVELVAATHAPLRSRKIVLAGAERMYANAVYQDSTVLVTTGTAAGVFPLYIPRDSLSVDKEQLIFGLGLGGQGRAGVTELRAISAEAQRQLLVRIADLGQEELIVPAGAFPAHKVSLEVRPFLSPDEPARELFLWYAEDGRLLRYHDPQLQATWLLSAFSGEMSPFCLHAGSQK